MSSKRKDEAAERARFAVVFPSLIATNPGEYVAIVGSRVFGPSPSACSVYVKALEHSTDGRVFVRQLVQGPRFQLSFLIPDE